jgi:3-dehydroquinate synthase
MKTFVITQGQRAHPLYLKRGLISPFNQDLIKRTKGRRFVIVSHKNLETLYRDTLEEAFGKNRCLIFLNIPEGEEYKNLQTLEKLYSQLLEKQVDRFDILVAFGGGLVLDLVGFAAGSYLRGLDLINIPTSLLAMVDAGFGGKCAVNLAAGKNLAGLFKLPLYVLIDPDFLHSLPEREIKNAHAEIVKHALLFENPSFFRNLCDDRLSLDDRIELSVKTKCFFVNHDLEDQGKRQHLNLGHSFAHAFEKLSDYRMSHGEAVSRGLVAALRLSEQMNLCDPSLREALTACLEKQGLPVDWPAFSAEKVWESLQNDKKRKNGKINFVLLEDIGTIQLSSEVKVECFLKCFS